jgi:hypothetical protein
LEAAGPEPALPRAAVEGWREVPAPVRLAASCSRRVFCAATGVRGELTVQHAGAEPAPLAAGLPAAGLAAAGRTRSRFAVAAARGAGIMEKASERATVEARSG